MRRSLCGFAAALALTSACVSPAGTPGAAPEAAPSNEAPARSPGQQATPRHLRLQGTSFITHQDVPFQWRGISAFRLAEMLARGRSADVEAYLDWARSQNLTVVRVFMMAHHLFRLSPEDGRAALPRLLDLAAARKLHVEIVALVDTAEITVDLDAHVRAIGELAVRYPNALIEIANEPGHPTQSTEVHRPDRLQKLASLVPEPVPVALGAVEYDDAFAAADYATWHVPRDAGHEGWGHVLRIADGTRLLARFNKPVVSDEPIGAGPKFTAGRRDDHPSRFAAAAALTRFVGLHPTFHYEGGLQAIPPSGRELECLEAWRRGLDLAARLPEDRGAFLPADRVSTLARISGARVALGRVAVEDAWLLLVDPAEKASVAWNAPWQAVEETGVPGVRLLRGRRP